MPGEPHLDHLAINKRITEIYAELDAMPLVLNTDAQFAREIVLDAELTVLKETRTRRLQDWYRVRPH
jgi:flagellar assembly factor FliW